MKLRIRAGDVHLIDLRTRLPFKYGIATMTVTPHAFVRLRVEVDGQVSTGIAADHLPPRWFTKDPNQSLGEEIAQMLRVIEHAVRGSAGLVADSPFDAWRQLWDESDGWGRSENLPPLLTHFGTSLVERALLEAVCRAAGQPFQALLHHNRLGIRLGDIHPELDGTEPSRWLPDQPLERIIARQTIGLADPLEESEIAAGERLDDGLPQALESSIRRYGLRHFKVKLSGVVDKDRERLGRVIRVLEAHGPADWAFSVDGNEAFHDVSGFRSYWEELRRTPELQRSFDRLLFVEQPLHRDVALDNRAAGSLKDWGERPSLIIDESDGELHSLKRALELGYAGTSHKNCKGIFKGIANACLLARLRGQQPERPFVLSGEDLVNIGPVALLQDLTLCAVLGISSVERNGHHYFAGLSIFPAAVQRQTLESHADLYHPSRDGWPTLTIENGTLSTGSVLRAPFGVGPVIDVEQFTRLQEYANR